MKKKPLRTTIILSIVIVILLIFSLISLDTFRGQIKEFALQKYNLKLRFNKPIDHSLWSPGHIILRDLDIFLDEKEIIHLSQLSISIQILPLLKNNLIVDRIDIFNTNIKMNLLDIAKIQQKILKNKKTAPKQTDTKPFDINIKSFTTNGLNIHYGKQLNIENINLRSSATSKKFKINQLSLFLFGAQLTSEGFINYSKKPIDLNLKGEYKKIQLKVWNSLLKKKKISMDGSLDMTYDITWQKDQPKAPQGLIKAHGYNLYFDGLDIDQLLAGFIDSREVGLLDVASFVTMGPIGALLTNTLEASKSIPGIGSGKSKIQHLNLNIQLENGLATMNDVALSTNDNRLAFKGNINLVRQEFEKFHVHILDDKGCSKILQEISGSLKKPNIGVTQTMSEGVISPLTDLLKKTKNLVGCKPIYTGVVAHP